MLLDSIRLYSVSIIRIELICNCWKLFKIFSSSSLNSLRGQYAITSFLITFLAQFALQFNLSWLLTLYTIYLFVGSAIWIHKRVYFYHRRLDSVGVNQTINNFEAHKHHASAEHIINSTGTLKHPNKNGNSNGMSSNSSTSGLSNNSENTNSLQRQRAMAYRDFRSVLALPRNNHREFALSLSHLASSIPKWIADKDEFDEMHFQILATRRDVINIILRAILIFAALSMIYFGD